MRLLLALLTLALAAPAASALTPDTPEPQPSLVPPALTPGASGPAFIENRGQWPDDVLFLTHVEGGRAWVTRTGIVYDFFEVERDESAPSGPDGRTGPDLPGPRRGAEPDDGRVRGHVVRLAFEGGEARTVGPEDALATRLNFFLGDDPARHASNVPVFEAVTLRGVYAGVDLRLASEAGALTLSFEADDAAALATVRPAVPTGEAIRDGEAGAVVATSLGDRALGVVQVAVRRGAEAGRYAARLSGGTVEADRARPVRDRPAQSDPAARTGGDGLLYSTFLGGSGSDSGYALAVDASGAVYIAGSTRSADFPTTPGAYDTSFNGSADAFVAKLDIGSATDPVPDLVPLNLTVSPTEGPAGSSATVSFTVLNQGGADAPATQTNVRISTSDTEITVDDPLLGTLTTPALAAGEQTSETVEVTIPSDLAAGPYHVWVILDVDGTAGQSNEENDYASTPFTVTGGTGSVFVYRAEFNQGAQHELVTPELLTVGEPSIPLIPGRDTVVRYYLFGESGPQEDYSATLRVSSDLLRTR